MAFGADAKEAFWAQRVGNSDGIRGMGAGSTRKNDGAEAFAPPDAIDRPSSTISSEARTMYEQYHLKAEKFQQQPPSD